MKIWAILVAFFTITYAYGQTITFDCDEVKKAEKPLPTQLFREAVETLHSKPIEAFPQSEKETELVAAPMHPFMYALQLAYGQHYSISISPDMIWTLIAQGMAQHVNANGEAMRHKFVSFEGKKKISINTRPYGYFEKGRPSNPWHKIIPVLADSIKTNIPNDYYQAIVSEYSTTTPTIRTAYEVTLLNSMKSYFQLEVRTMCGIPSITLEGTPADWKKLLKNTKALKQYGASYWVDELEPILKQFVKASEGKVDKQFWQNIYKRRGGSGGPYITGWIIKFFPYVGESELKQNPYLHKEAEGAFAGLISEMLPSGLAEAPFKWLYFGEKFDMAFVAGFVGIKQDSKTLTLRPEISWFVKEASNQTSKNKK